MRLLCTCPGRFGDLLWALPTCRALAAHTGTPVDLLIAGEFGAIASLLTEQPYINCVTSDPAWNGNIPVPPAPITLPIPPGGRVVHLGYPRWPELPLPSEIAHTAATQLPWFAGRAAIDLATPWITPTEARIDPTPATLYGWNDTHFELKVGLSALLRAIPAQVLAAPGSRWAIEAGVPPIGWIAAAQRIVAADRVVADCSALHVLAVAIGRPVILVEPMEARWNPIFYPRGMDGPAVRVVRGTDGRPTYDARHVKDAIACA